MRTLFASCLSILLFASAAAAQDATSTPAPGVRAAGMGGAFTAVADDASAVYWNPAGLASAGFFSLVLDRNSGDAGSAGLIAIGTPPLGLSYYRTASRGVDGDGRSFVAHHAGVTVLQSLADRIAVGATVKVVHGTLAQAGSAAASSNKVDLDLGIHAAGALGSLGLAVHNLTEPSFRGVGDRSFTLERQVRAGMSLNTGRLTTVSADLDLTTVHDVAERPLRDAALGAETHPSRKAWLRGGVHWNTAGDTAAPVGSVGASYAVYGSTLADAQVSFGSGDGNRGWGIGLRFVF